MNIENIINELKTTGTRTLEKKIGINQKKIRKAIKLAGYEYQRQGKAGWQYTSTGKPPLEKDIQEFIITSKTNSIPKNKKEEGKNNSLTTREMKIFREKVKGLETGTEVIDTTIKERKEPSRKFEQSIHLLHTHAEEGKSTDKLRKTVSLDKGTCTMIDTLQDKYRLSEEEIVQIALHEFFAKYK
ncbi:hypothetical protein [Bacillus sp. 123MFChir2]|uniref:hypothetical protein n=1 Tax=Bacillus sp. 123MFChir2 TaxID=1169144 RepID=UPI000364A865|nr:hypothetical protein [Bacillus sp. 123MFChir2]